MRLLYSLLLFCTTLAVCAQSADEVKRLQKWLVAAHRFDHDFPREKVALHFDNTAYFEGDTIWYKAYVVRASTLAPAALSRVLYVELLNAEGQMVERSVLRVDSLGQAHGEFALNNRRRTGFYEVRAYTREMTNWGPAACFSRVLPVFAKTDEENKGEYTNLQIRRLEHKTDLHFNVERPFVFGRSSARRVDFFPEGGHRIKGLGQRVAYLMTDGNGHPTTDTLRVFTPSGQLVASSAAEHLGMGAVWLPEGMDEGYAEVNGRRFPLPQAQDEGATLTLTRGDGEVTVVVQKSDAAEKEVGLAVFCRERLHYFLHFPLDDVASEVSIPDSCFGYGVNRIEIFTSEGRSLASRLYYNAHDSRNFLSQRNLQLQVAQSQRQYAPFSPIALELHLADQAQRPVEARLSVAVRDDEGVIVGNNAASLEAEWLLASEVKGYIHRPDYYFQKNDARTHRALDLLLMVQGWTATSFEQMCRRDTFEVKQPIEDRLIVRGQLLQDNERKKPYPGLKLNLSMFTLDGASAKGEAVTDENGRFAFTSNIDFVGQWMGVFTSTDLDKGKRRWSRLTLDRDFAPAPRPFHQLEMKLENPRRWWQEENSGSKSSVTAPPLFQWRDTIPYLRSTNLPEALVVKEAGRKYRPLTFNRYTYGGGEKAGERRAQVFYDAAAELERVYDRGHSFTDMYSFLAYLVKGFRAEYKTYAAEMGSQDLSEKSATSPTDKASPYERDWTTPKREEVEIDESPATLERDFEFNGRPLYIQVNNGAGALGGSNDFIEPQDIKSVMISLNYQDAVHAGGARNKEWAGVIYVYTREDGFRLKGKKGVAKRFIQGFSLPAAFPNPNFRANDIPSTADYRRTLHWNPMVATDASGKASVVFFGNAREGQHLRISVRGITADGRWVSFER